MEKQTVIDGHSLKSSFYRHTYLKNIPHGLCDYVWGLFFALLALPFTWTIILYNVIKKNITFDKDANKYHFEYGTEKPAKGVYYTLVIMCVGLFSIVLIDTMCASYAKSLLNSVSLYKGLGLVYCFGLLGCVTIFCTGYLTFIIFCFVSDVIPEKKPKIVKTSEDKKPSTIKLIWLWLKAVKEKNCPIMAIDYTKKPKK